MFEVTHPATAEYFSDNEGNRLARVDCQSLEEISLVFHCLSSDNASKFERIYSRSTFINIFSCSQPDRPFQSFRASQNPSINELYGTVDPRILRL